MFTFPIKGLSNFCPWVYFEKFLDVEECQVISEITDGVKSFDHPSYKEVDQLRIYWSDEMDWLFQKIYNTIVNVNSHRYLFDLDGMNESLERFTYHSKGSMVWHIDSTPGNNIATNRKLTFSIQLTDPSEYDGGDLEMFDGKITKAPRGLGAMIIYPTYIYHRVTDINWGSRTSLIGHVHGVPFR